MITYLKNLPSFPKFVIVGTLGFVVDSLALLFAIHVLGLDKYSGRLFSFLVAVTFTWLGHRSFTFADRKQDNLFKEWLTFFVANSTGGIINYITYSLLVTFVPLVNQQPVLGVAAGALVAMLFNYAASSRFVFRKS